MLLQRVGQPGLVHDRLPPNAGCNSRVGLAWSMTSHPCTQRLDVSCQMRHRCLCHDWPLVIVERHQGGGLALSVTSRPAVKAPLPPIGINLHRGQAASSLLLLPITWRRCTTGCRVSLKLCEESTDGLRRFAHLGDD